MPVPLFRRHPREWGPVERLVAVGIAAAIGVAVVVTVLVMTSRGPGRCGEDLEESGGDCVGVTAESFDVDDPVVQSLIDAVAKENAEVERTSTSSSTGPQVPYVRIALMMPFTSDDRSAMSPELIRRGLAGTLAAQREANKEISGLRYQLLLAPNGRNLNQWRPAVERLEELAKDDKAPLIGVTGIPSSTLDTQAAVSELSQRHIPTVGPTVTATTLNAPYFYKIGPNNEQLIRALQVYLKEYPGQHRGFLVWDTLPGDTYAEDLKKVFEQYFGEDYDLDDHNSNFAGSVSNQVSIPARFDDATRRICTEERDTVFFAGRDRDLPTFLDYLADLGDCKRTSNLRIVKVGVGIDPAHTTPEVDLWLKKARAIIVDASSVDPDWWGKDARDTPDGFDEFHAQFKEIQADYFAPVSEQLRLDLRKQLDDGYAIEYHDAFTLLVKAAERTDTELRRKAEKSSSSPAPLTPENVHSTLNYPTIVDNACNPSCLHGAAGTYGFEGPGKNDQWAVCKPVPVVVYPRPEDERPMLTYRTYRGTTGNACDS